ncbi:MAG: hypothetical protein AAF483_04665 [Planctomycetota bacterium]
MLKSHAGVVRSSSLIPLTSGSSSPSSVSARKVSVWPVATGVGTLDLAGTGSTEMAVAETVSATTALAEIDLAETATAETVLASTVFKVTGCAITALAGSDSTEGASVTFFGVDVVSDSEGVFARTATTATAFGFDEGAWLMDDLEKKREGPMAF